MKIRGSPKPLAEQIFPAYLTHTRELYNISHQTGKPENHPFRKCRLVGRGICDRSPGAPILPALLWGHSRVGCARAFPSPNIPGRTSNQGTSNAPRMIKATIMHTDLWCINNKPITYPKLLHIFSATHIEVSGFLSSFFLPHFNSCWWWFLPNAAHVPLPDRLGCAQIQPKPEKRRGCLKLEASTRSIYLG